jgi:hypothetical protein
LAMIYLCQKTSGKFYLLVGALQQYRVLTEIKNQFTFATCQWLFCDPTRIHNGGGNKVVVFKTRMTVIGLALAGVLVSGASYANEKNWTPPKEKIAAQTLADEIMAKHPELLSVTFHGVPPKMEKVYTMFAGSYHDRIGNADDPDDIDVITKGITIVDPRWHKTKDTVKKFVVQAPLRDASGTNVGLIVYAFKNDNPPADPEMTYYKAAMDLRNEVQKKIASYDALFEPAK